MRGCSGSRWLGSAYRLLIRHASGKRCVTAVDAQVLNLVAEVADDVLESQDDFVPARQFFLQPCYARVALKFVWCRSRNDPSLLLGRTVCG